MIATREKGRGAFDLSTGSNISLVAIIYMEGMEGAT